MPETVIATGFVADLPEESSAYPSAGGDSSSPAFQAVYWRCIAAFLFSCAVNAPDYRRVVFSNVAPPVVDGIELARTFEALGAEHIVLPLSHRLPGARKWGNVFYFLDILRHLNPGSRLALFDSDVVLAGSAEPLLGRIEQTGLVGYVTGAPADRDVNGLTMRRAAEIATGLGKRAMPPSIPHFGGELLGIDLSLRADAIAIFESLWHDIAAGKPEVSEIRTEEHLWSIAFAAQGWPVADAGDQLKRIWTARQHRTVQPGDENLAMWHLPAEKRYGVRDMFAWMAKREFDIQIAPEELRQLMQTFFGIPKPSAGKRLRDLARGVRYKISPN